MTAARQQVRKDKLSGQHEVESFLRIIVMNIMEFRIFSKELSLKLPQS